MPRLILRRQLKPPREPVPDTPVRLTALLYSHPVNMRILAGDTLTFKFADSVFRTGHQLETRVVRAHKDGLVVRADFYLDGSITLLYADD
jgi:hypothetical protein